MSQPVRRGRYRYEDFTWIGARSVRLLAGGCEATSVLLRIARQMKRVTRYSSVSGTLLLVQ
jgi:hypothetical protein